ncbi:MAG: hypothetical protein JSV47_07115 [Deltaproteobacteria bacterium]|nr:MAG: hypothetical protein JSV47_07115 [Deltaproteobacteria bacterium]
MMEVNSRLVKFKIKPASYPLMKLYFNEQLENQDNALEAETEFPKEFWINLANTCREVARGMSTFSSQKIVMGLNLMSQGIMAEVEAEDKRLRNKEVYESFLDFVIEVNGRTDLDKVRKGQMIHDTARKLQLHP